MTHVAVYGRAVAELAIPGMPAIVVLGLGVRHVAQQYTVHREDPKQLDRGVHLEGQIHSDQSITDHRSIQRLRR